MSPFNRSKGMSRRDFLRLSAAGLSSAAFAGSVRGMSWRRPETLQEATEEGPDPATMTGHVLIWGYNGTIDHYKAAKDDLQAKYPGLQIETQEFGYLDAHANILNALNSGVGVPDLCNFDVDYVGDFADGMADLTERMAPYADKFVPIALKLAGRDGAEARRKGSQRCRVQDERGCTGIQQAPRATHRQGNRLRGGAAGRGKGHQQIAAERVG